MTWRALIWKELRERPATLATCLLAILLGVAAVVAVRTITVHSERAVASQLAALGANVLVLPREATLHDYYAADLHGLTLPEEHAVALAMAGVEGVEHIAPKLCVPATLAGRPVTLTGILPQSEFEAQAAWQGAAMLRRRHVGCKNAHLLLDDPNAPPETLATRRIIHDLGDDQAVVGADVARLAGVSAGQTIELLGQPLTVLAVLPATDTIDDGRVFAHLHTVQRLAKAGKVVNVIEILGCCEDAAGGMVPQLAGMFPDARVTAIGQIVETQVEINRLMARLSYLFVVILVLAGGATIAGAMFANVTERRREIGTLVALGASKMFVARMFLGKALLVGLVGGVLGYAAGSGVAAWLGPQWAGIAVWPIPSLALVAVGLAVATALSASYWPALRAAGLDPCRCLQEV
jgi:putative ABC transport system permease protein